MKNAHRALSIVMHARAIALPIWTSTLGSAQNRLKGARRVPRASDRAQVHVARAVAADTGAVRGRERPFRIVQRADSPGTQPRREGFEPVHRFCIDLERLVDLDTFVLALHRHDAKRAPDDALKLATEHAGAHASTPRES